LTPGQSRENLTHRAAFAFNARRATTGSLLARSQDAQGGKNNAIRLLRICSTSRAARASLCPSTDGAFMDRTATDQTIKVFLTEIHRRLDEAARIAKAAEACALAGSVGDGVSVSMDIEQLIYEAGRPQDAASLLDRLSRE
jgi:hypothetical protein